MRLVVSNMNKHGVCKTCTMVIKHSVILYTNLVGNNHVKYLNGVLRLLFSFNSFFSPSLPGTVHLLSFWIFLNYL